MFRLVGVRPYKDGRGHRFTFQTERDLFLRGDEGHLVFVPKGRRVEVSVLEAAPDHGGPEVALIYQEAFLWVERGVEDPEAVLRMAQEVGA
jgi:hypothetical protein